MNRKGISSIVIILIIVGVLVIAGGVWYWQSQKKINETANWKTYRNEEYGFEVKYPAKYESAENESGWPNAVLLLIREGGYAQSYSMAIEIWDSESAFKSKYGTNPDFIRNIDNKWITIWNINEEKEIEEVISTFKSIQETTQETTNWKSYRNEKYDFEVKYPGGYNVKIDNDEVGLLIVNFRNSQENSFYGIHVTQNSKTPKLSNFLSNPECYEQIKTETQNNLDWTISWWKCSAGGDKNPIAAYNVKENYVFEVSLDSDSQDLSLERINKILSTFKFID